MKYIGIISVILISFLKMQGAPLMAQERDVDSIFDRHAGQSGYTSVTYGRKMLEMMKRNSSAEASEVISGLEVIRILTCKGEKSGALLEEAGNTARTYGYELISQVGEDTVSTAFFFKDESKGKSSFLMVSGSPEETTVLDIYGEFDIRDISRISSIGKK